jgi:hypothetical protein
MKLNRLNEGRAYEDTFTVKKWDGHEPQDDVYVEPFDVDVTYSAEDLSSEHPYGEDFAVEHIFDLGIVTLEAAEPVNVYDNETEEVVEVLPAGTDIREIPGWTDDMDEWFYEQAVSKYEGR